MNANELIVDLFAGDDSAHAWHLPRADAERITAHCGPEKRITIQAAPLHRQVVA